MSSHLPSLVARKHDFVAKVAGGCSSYDVIAPWPDLTRSNFLLPNIAQGLPHKVAQNPAALRAAVFFAIRQKPQGGGGCTKPPVRARVKCCMSPTFGPFSKFSGGWGKSSHVFEQWANWFFYVFSITVPFHRMNLVWNHTILTAVNVYWWLSAWTEYVLCPACWIILPYPWGKLVKTQLFGEHHFKGFCENVVFLVLPRICSQKIKDSQSILTSETPCLAMNERARKR